MPDWLRRAMAARPDATRRPVQGDSRGAIPTIGPARGMRGVPVPRGEAQGVGTPAGSVPVLDAAARDPRQTALDVLSSIPGAEIPVSAGAATARAVSGDPVGTAAYMAAALPLVAAAPARKAVSFLDEIDLGGQKIARYKTPAGDAWITYSQDGEVLDIINAGASTGENSLGARAVIQIRDDLAKRTGAKKMRGWRVSGAGPFRDAEIDLARPNARVQTDSMPAFVRKGIEAYHGSPHKFDKFDLEKIGTGEGAQAYGHGLYFADTRDVAQRYRKIRDFEWKGSEPVDAEALSAASSQYDFDAAHSPEHFARHLRFMSEHTDPDFADDFLRAADHVERGNIQPKFDGHLYRVNLDVDPDDLLDLDLPLSEQSQKVKDVLQRENYGAATDETRDGHSFYDALSGIAGDPAEASEDLRRAGIPGVRYLDGFSRAAGKGTRNYVMFDDKRINILERLAALGLLAGGSGAIAAKAAKTQKDQKDSQ
jgi:hypothetical protein